VASVSALSIYPIKSTRGIELQASAVGATGLSHDRRWAVVDASGRIMTGREYPKLLALRTSIGQDSLAVHRPGSSLDIPFPQATDPIEPVNLWAEEQHPGVRAAGPVNEWFSDYLGVACSLVFMDERCRREIPTELPSGYHGHAGQLVSYADDFPILLAGEASLADLNARLDQPVGMAHFRPNIVVAGSAAFEEDTWQRIRIGECEFERAQLCPRCVFVTIDPDSLKKSPRQEPLRTLARYRSAPAGGVPFGVQFIPRRLGTLRVGDRVELLPA
jgi:uncharacterized protein YcbX